MCGFFIEKSTPLSHRDAFVQLLNMGAERGPDSQGVWADEHIQMGFNRLAILDLSEAGSQPMHSASGRWAICFNGEIYNHLDIRDEIGADQQHWRGHSDTETILAAIEKWGLREAVQKLDGMFAMALWDKLEKKLYLIRDFAGIKPLWFGHKNNTIVAASQYDQIIRHPAFAREPLNEEVLQLYLEQHYIPAPFGLHRHCAQLEPGEIKCFLPDGRVTSEFYWQFPEEADPLNINQADALARLSYELHQSVRSEMISDVPLGAFLSGGIDSPLVGYYAQKSSEEQLKTFTIGSDSLVHDESEDAALYAKLIHSDHHSRTMDSSDALTIMNQVMQAMHEPLADFSLIPTWLVSSLAKEKVTVALSGDGGDELFFGYERFESVSKNYPLFGLPNPIKYGLYGFDKLLFKNKHLNSGLLFPSAGKAHRSLHSRFKEQQRSKLFPDLSQVSTPEAYQTYDYRSENKASLLHQMRKAEFYGMMQKTLRKVDLASMNHSLEVRVPFLKKSFIESALKYPFHLSFGLNKRKQLLKDLLRKNLPESPIDNRKRGFSVPLDQWIRQDLYTYFADHLLDKSFTQSYGIHAKALETLLLEHKQGKADHKWALFTVLALCSFERGGR